MDSDSDVEIVPNSIDDGYDIQHSLGSTSSSSNASLPSLSKKRVHPRSSISRPTITTTATTSTTASKIAYNSSSKASTSKLPLDTSSSDIEFIAGPSTHARGAGTDLTNRIRSLASSSSKRSAPIGGFKSAAAILKYEAKRERAAAKRRSSSASSDAANTVPDKAATSRKASPYFSSDSDTKGKQREASLPPPLTTYSKTSKEQRQLEDEDDDILELPPPLRATKTKSASPVKALLEEEDMLSEQSQSPGSAFRNTLSKFKAPSIASTSASSRATGSLFTARASSKGAVAYDITLSSDSSFASTSDSISSTKRARSSFASSSTTTASSGQLQLPTPFLAVITTCPTCSDIWTVAKDTKTKLNHIRKCAIQKSFSNEEVERLIEEQVRALHDKAAEENKKHHDNRTLLEGLLSKRGKDVQVVGVEKKKKKLKDSTNSIEKGVEMEHDTSKPVMLATQGGSTFSQATSTQVQKELNKRIKTNQRIERGDFLNVPLMGQASTSDGTPHSTSDATAREGSKSILAEAATKGRKKKGAADVSGIGSKNWLKAAQLLKAKEAEVNAAEGLGASSLLSTSHIGASITSTLASENSKGKQRASSTTNSMQKNKLVPYSDLKYRLAEKVKDIAASRTRQIDSSAESDISTNGQDIIMSDDGLDRPYRNPSDLSLSLLDLAIQRGSEKKKQGYDAWALAGTLEDTVKDRCVSQSSPNSSSPPLPQYVPMSDFSASDDECILLRQSSMLFKPRPSTPSTTRSRSTSPARDPHPLRTPPSSPPIGKLSLSSSAPSSPVHLSPTQYRIHYDHYIHTLSSDSTLAGVPDTATINTGSSHLPAPDLNSLLSTNTPTAPVVDLVSNNIPDDSSNGLFKNSAALQALTQRLKTTSSSSINPALVARRVARMTGSSAAVSSILSQVSASSSSIPLRSYSTTPKIDAKADGNGKLQEEYEMMVSSQENAHMVDEIIPKASTSMALLPAMATEEKVKKPRGRPKKVSLDAAGTCTKASPKRKTKDEDLSPPSETDGVSVAASKQGSLAFQTVKKGKATSSTTVKKKAVDSDAPSPRKKKAATVDDTEPAIPLAALYPGIPDYESWSKEKLQAETGKYGYKAAGTKKVLIDQLVRVWKAINPELFAVPEKAESVPPWRARSRSASPKGASLSVKAAKAKQVKAVSDLEEDDSAILAEPPENKTKKASIAKASKKPKATSSATSAKSKAIATARAKRKASLSRSIASDMEDNDPDDEDSDVHENDVVGENEIDTVTAPEELKTAGERLRDAILKDEKFYLRILRYEPIQFDDFEMMLAACKIKMSKIALRDWLDTQGIVFYYDQATGRNAQRNGARKRHA